MIPPPHPAATFAAACAVVLVGCAGEQSPPPLFEALSPERSGVTFANRVAEDDTFNILDLEYVYNGGGVGVGDFDGDGREDLYLTGNTAANALYLNRGDLRFEDATAAAGVGAPERWSSGVAVVDINADGLDDLYVSATVLEPGPRRANRLFVNLGPGDDGVPRFRESAQAYGLADTSHTTQAAFLDYDGDGDLDAYLVANVMDDKRLPNRYGPKRDDGSSPRNDRLYRNDGLGPAGHPTFTDVTREAGLLADGYGLGVAVGDLNGDRLPDVYVANDYLTNDLAWVNQGDGTFRDAAPAMFGHTSHSAMGVDVADVNGDARADVVTLDMLPASNRRRKTMMPAANFNAQRNNERYGYQYQYMRNVLQLNRGPLRAGDSLPVFSEVGQQAGIAATDWSWSVLAADVDLDADADLLITNGFPRDVTDLDFTDYSSTLGQFTDPAVLLAKIPAVALPDYAFAGDGGAVPAFTDVSAAWGFAEPSFSAGAALADLDGDGDLDYVVNRTNDSAVVYRNAAADAPGAPATLTVELVQGGGNRGALGATIDLYSAGRRQSRYLSPYRGYLSSSTRRQVFSLANAARADSLVVAFPNGRVYRERDVAPTGPEERRLIDAASLAPGTHAAAFAKTDPPLLRDVTAALGLDYVHDEPEFVDFDVQRLLPRQLSRFGPALAAGDATGDGLDDLVIGGARDRADVVLAQRPDGTFAPPARLPTGIAGETTAVTFLDADGDGAADDLYLGRGGVEARAGDAALRDVLLLRDGDGLHVASDALPPGFATATSVACAGDVDGDGDVDVFVGARTHAREYPRPAPSALLLNDGTGRFRPAADDAIAALGMVSDAALADVDGDGRLDLLVAEDLGPVRLLRWGVGGFTARDLTAPGAWTRLTAADLDGDGDLDVVAGNLGRNHPYHRAGASLLRVYAADFDGNGTVDAIPATRFPDAAGALGVYPYNQRQELGKQVVAVKGAYPFHRDFAEETAAGLIGRLGAEAVTVAEATAFASVTLENVGDGAFASRPLPAEAQVAPVYGFGVADVDDDGQTDLLVVGNEYANEVRGGRQDGLHGLVLLGSERLAWRATGYAEAGFAAGGDVKALTVLRAAGGGNLFVVGRNLGSLLAFEVRGSE